MKIVQFGVPRSGSTLVYQILKKIIDCKVIKVHDYLPGDIVVCTFRDFRDSVISNWRVVSNPDKNKKINREDIFNNFKHIEKSIYSLNRYKSEKSNKILFLRYEDFVCDYSLIYNSISKTFGVSLDDNRIEKISIECSFKKNKDISSKYNSFREWDKDSQIHGLHLYKGEIGTWKEFVKESDESYINGLLYSYLKEWNYEI